MQSFGKQKFLPFCTLGARIWRWLKLVLTALIAKTFAAQDDHHLWNIMVSSLLLLFLHIMVILIECYCHHNCYRFCRHAIPPIYVDNLCVFTAFTFSTFGCFFLKVFFIPDMHCTYFVLALLTQQTNGQQTSGQQQCCQSRMVGGTGEKVLTNMHWLDLKRLSLK